jgi:hypothetical protein
MFQYWKHTPPEHETTFAIAVGLGILKPVASERPAVPHQPPQLPLSPEFLQRIGAPPEVAPSAEGLSQQNANVVAVMAGSQLGGTALATGPIPPVIKRMIEFQKHCIRNQNQGS